MRPRSANICEREGPLIFLCKDSQGARDPDTLPDPSRDDYGAVWMSWWVDDVDAVHAECVREDVQVVRPPIDEPWGVREFLIRHPDGHYFRISGSAQRSESQKEHLGSSTTSVSS